MFTHRTGREGSQFLAKGSRRRNNRSQLGIEKLKMDEKKVLVTGGAGYIGSHACKALKQSGLIPVTFDNLVTGWRDAVKFAL